MKRIFLPILALLLLAGCNATPARRAFIGVEAATDVVNGINTAATVSPSFRKQLPKLAPYVDAEKKAADDLDNAILAGKVDLTTYLGALTDAVTELLNAKAAANKAAATQP